MTLKLSCSESKPITFYRSPRMSNQEEKQKERSQLTSTHKNSMNYLPKRGGGGEGGPRATNLNISCSKSNFIAFNRSTGMRNQVQTQKERSQGISVHENSMQYLLRVEL